MRMMSHIAVLVFAISFAPLCIAAVGATDEAVALWQQLEPGLEFAEFTAPQPADNGDSLIHVVRIDLRYFDLRLLNASATADHELLTAKEWCQQHQLVAAINASMYQQDYLSSVSLMRTRNHVNNPRLSHDKAILAFDPRVKGIPRVKIIDRQCDDFARWQPQYATFIQSIRMISCKGSNVWRQNQEKKWSTSVIALDAAERVLFIHVRARYSTHDLIEQLLALPLGLTQAMYTEGGREAQLYLHSGDTEYEFVGVYSAGFDLSSAIPNVVGIVRRKQVAAD